MTPDSIKDQNDTLASLNQALQECVASQDMDKAMDLALQRQKALIKIFECLENDPSNLANLKKISTETLECLSKEKVLIRNQSTKKRNDFLLRKNAIKAYMSPIAA